MQSGRKSMLLGILNGLGKASVKTIAIMDIGAMLEGTPRYSTLVDHEIATVVGFEPQTTEYEKLCRTAPHTHRYFPVFLGKGGRAKFHKTRYPGCSSLYEPDPALIDLFATIGAGAGGNFQVLETSDVETVRLDDVGNVPKPDLVKLDVQGAELDVLEGGSRTIAGALVIEAEVEFVPLYKNQPLFGEVHGFLRRNGFQFHKLIDVGGRGFAPLTPSANARQPISQLLWADAVFVRDFSKVAGFTEEDLLKAAVIVDEVYKSYDLAAFFLAEYDRRRGSDLREHYTAELLRTSPAPMLLNIREI